MTTQRAFRQEAADPKPMTRAALEAAAATHGVTVVPSMSDRALAEAVCERLAPGAFTFAGRTEYTYALHAARLMIARAEGKAEAEKAAAAAPAPVVAPSSAVPKAALNGTGAAIHADAAGSRPLSSEEARDRMIEDAIRNGQR